MTIILDAAHGEETPGKRSPDGRFREYKWSREIISKLKKELESQGYEVFESNPTDKEIGLSKRVANTNKIARAKKIFISLHSDAAGNGST
jgi:N-acetylmuramoyl-L-alanine amidase